MGHTTTSTTPKQRDFKAKAFIHLTRNMICNMGIVVIFIAMEAFVQFTLGLQIENDYDDYNFIDRFRPGHESNINWAHVSHAPSIEFDVSSFNLSSSTHADANT